MSHTEFLPSACKLPWEQPETASVVKGELSHTRTPWCLLLPAAICGSGSEVWL